MSDDVWDDPNAKLWIEHVLEGMAPKLQRSAMSIAIVPDNKGNVKFWVELGASIMMDKPIIAVGFSDRKMPEKLLKVADEVVILPEGVDADATEELKEALKRVLERLK